MAEREEDGPREEDASAPETPEAAPEARRNNDSTISLSESEFLALQVPAASPPAVPTPRPTVLPARSVSRNDASMWAGSVMVADEFEPLVVPRRPLGRWILLSCFALGVGAAALYFLWWQPAQEVAAAEPETPEVAEAAAKPVPVEAAVVAEPTPAPDLEPAPEPAAEPPPAEAAAVAPEEKPAAAPVKKTVSKKKTASKKKSSKKKKKSSSKKKKKRRRG